MLKSILATYSVDPGNTRRWDRCVGDGSDTYGASVKCRLACWASMIIRWDPSGLGTANIPLTHAGVVVNCIIPRWYMEEMSLVYSEALPSTNGGRGIVPDCVELDSMSLYC